MDEGNKELYTAVHTDPTHISMGENGVRLSLSHPA